MRLLIFGIPKCPHSQVLVKDAKVCNQKPKMIDIYKKPELAIKYNINAFPTIVIVSDSGKILKLIGNVGQNGLGKWLMENNID